MRFKRAFNVAALLVCQGVFTQPARSAEPLVFGMYSSAARATQAVMNSVIRHFISKVNQNKWVGRPVRHKIYLSEAAIMKDAAAGKAHLIFMDNPLKIMEAHDAYGFEPVAKLSSFGLDKIRFCLMVPVAPKSGKPKLKNGITAIPKYFFNFYMLRSLVKTNPLEYFRVIKTNSDQGSGLLQLSLGQLDSVISSTDNLAHTQATNPGVMKRIKPFYCTTEYMQTAVMAAPSVDLTTRKEIQTLLAKIQHLDMGQFSPVVKSTKIHFIPVGASTYAKDWNYWRKDTKGEVVKEFNNWLQLSGEK